MENRQKRSLSFLHWNAEHPIPFLLAVCLGVGALSCLFPGQNGLGWGMMLCAGVSFLVWAVLTACKKLPAWGDGVLWWGIGGMLRLSRILHDPYTRMQHDVNTFSDPDGHAGYIMYLYRHLHLPDTDVRDTWQFYHPPLHHLLEAVWLHLTRLFLPDGPWEESAQVLPFAYSCLTLAVFALLLRHFSLKGFAFVLPFSVMALHPSQLILSGSLNNDCLSLLFMVSALLLTLRWLREERLRDLLGLAAVIGLGMFTKLSAWMAAPAAAFVFLVQLVQAKPEARRPLIGKFALFGSVCVPIGLFWTVRNALRWGVPAAYIPMLADDSKQYVGGHPITERLFDLSLHQFSYIYDCYTMYGQAYNEYNPLIGLLKTAVFDEFVNTDRYPAVAGFGEVLFWSGAVLAGIALAAMVSSLRRREQRIEKTAVFLTWAITLVCYISFCLTYQHTCTQSFRYAVPTLWCSLLFLGLWCKADKPRWARLLLSAVTGIFLLSSFAVYGILLYR